MVKIIPRDAVLYYVYYIYMVIATLGLVTNAVFLVLCFASKKLRSACRLYIAIAVADSILSLAFLTTGYKRSTEMEIERGFVSFKSASACAREYNVALLTLGSICPAYLTLYMGVDRFLSVKFPQIWNKLRFQQTIAITLVFLFSLFCLFVGVVYGSLFLKNTDTPICTCSGAYGAVFGTYVYTSTIVGQTGGFVLSVLAWRLLKRCPPNAGRMKKEKATIRISLFATSSSFFLAAIPNIVLFCLTYGDYSPILAGSLYSTICFRATLNLFIFGAMNREFRKCIYVMCATKVIDVSTLTNSTPHTYSTSVERRTTAQQRQIEPQS